MWASCVLLVTTLSAVIQLTLSRKKHRPTVGRVRECCNNNGFESFMLEYARKQEAFINTIPRQPNQKSKAHLPITKTILLDDGFNGSKALFDPTPIVIDGDLVKLRCAEPGKEYMTAWKRKGDVARAVAALTARTP